MIVDDDVICRSLLKEQLSSLGIENIVEFDNGSDVVSYYANNYSEISLVLLDMRMPVMDGEACFYALTSICKNVPIFD